MAKSIYQRLTGRKRTLFGFSQLWLAPDHILLVRSTRFTENYQRFSLADIQAIVVTELPDRVAFQFVVLAAIIAGAAGFFAVTGIFLKALLASVTLVALSVLIANIALGPRARCDLQTAVTQELLSPVTRVRSAQKFLQRIRPAIDAVQGTLTPERTAAIEIPSTSAATPDKPPEIPRTPGYLPEVLFLLFLANAAIVLASVRFPKADLSSVLLTTIAGEVVIAVVALVRRAGRDPRRFIYALVVAAIFGIGWDAFHMAGSFFDFINGTMEAAKQKPQPKMLSITTWTAFTQTTAMIAAVWRIAAGAIGLAAAWLERR